MTDLLAVLRRPTIQWTTIHAVRSKLTRTGAPKTIEAVLRRLVHEPIAGLAVCNAQPGERATHSRIWEAWRLHGCCDLERLTHVRTNVICELLEVGSCVDAFVDVNTRCVPKCNFKFGEELVLHG